MITIDGVRMSEGAARNVEAAGVTPSEDVRRVREGTSRETLLAECLDGCEDERAITDWVDYVDAVMLAA